MRHAVEGRFLAAGPTGLLRRAGRVQPDIHAVDEVLRCVQVVLFHKGDVAAEAVVLGEGIDLADEVLAMLVGRVGLAREDDLDRPPGILHQALEAFQVPEQQRRTLVSGEAPREPDRQRIRIQQRTGG